MAQPKRCVPSTSHPSHSKRFAKHEGIGGGWGVILRASVWSAGRGAAPYTDRLRPVSRSDWMTVAVGFSPRLPGTRICVAERRLSGRICQPFKRRSATPTRLVLHRGLKPTATLGRRSATKPNQLSTIHVRSRRGGERGSHRFDLGTEAGFEVLRHWGGAKAKAVTSQTPLPQSKTLARAMRLGFT
jgi:hypothetical protein